jgi:hypothetical protein
VLPVFFCPKFCRAPGKLNCLFNCLGYKTICAEILLFAQVSDKRCLNQLNFNTMKKFFIPFIMLALMISLGSCTAIGDIFKAGAAVGIIAVVIVIAIIIWIISMFRGKS